MDAYSTRALDPIELAITQLSGS